MSQRLLSDRTDGLLLLLWGCWVTLVLSLGYFPSQDGPSHIYNAFVLSNIDTPPYAVVYRAAWELVPNLAGTALLIALGSILPWALAEKALVLLFTTAFILGTRHLCRSRATDTAQFTPPVVLLALPFALSAPLFYGFYSYCIGMALVPWIWALAPTDRGISRIVLSALCVLCWASHVASCLIGLTGAAIFGFTRQRKPMMRLLIALLPTLVLLGHYLLQFPAQQGIYWDAERIAEYGVFGRALFAFDGWLEWVAVACTVVIVRNAVANQVDKQGLINTAIITVLYITLPDGSAEHWFLSLRLSILPLFALMIASANRQSSSPIMIAVFGIIATAHLLGTGLGYYEASHDVDEYVSAQAHVPDGARILTLDDLGPPHPSRSNTLLHASSWIALHRTGIDVSNYEPHRNHFQLKLTKFAGYPEPNRLMDAITQEAVQPFLRYSDAILYRTAKPLQFKGFMAHEELQNVHVLVRKDCRLHTH